jgi:hypothetical protein
MSLSVEALWKMSAVELVAAYYETRRRYIEMKFARDTQRARLEWLKAKAFAAHGGGVTERRNSVEVSEELARKGQELREKTLELDLLRADVDLVAMIVRLRGALSPNDAKAEDGEDQRDDGA